MRIRGRVTQVIGLQYHMDKYHIASAASAVKTYSRMFMLHQCKHMHTREHFSSQGFQLFRAPHYARIVSCATLCSHLDKQYRHGKYMTSPEISCVMFKYCATTVLQYTKLATRNYWLRGRHDEIRGIQDLVFSRTITHHHAPSRF